MAEPWNWRPAAALRVPTGGSEEAVPDAPVLEPEPVEEPEPEPAAPVAVLDATIPAVPLAEPEAVAVAVTNPEEELAVEVTEKKLARLNHRASPCYKLIDQCADSLEGMILVLLPEEFLTTGINGVAGSLASAGVDLESCLTVVAALVGNV